MLEFEPFKSDHRVVETRIGIGVNREPKEARVNFKRIKKGRFNRRVAENLAVLGLPDLGDSERASDFARKLIETMRSCIDEELNRSRRNQLIASLPQLIAEEMMKETERRPLPCNAEGEARSKQLADLDPLQVAEKLARRVRNGGWRDFLVVKAACCGPNSDIFKAVKAAERATQPRQMACMPNLSKGKVKDITDEQNAEIVLQSMFPEYCHAVSDPPNLDLPPPLAGDLNGESPHCPRHLEPGEMERLFKELPLGRSPLPDWVGNEAFKLSMEASLPYVRHLFEACLKLGFHPKPFRDAVLKLLKKQGKPTYTDPYVLHITLSIILVH